jgi:hypothetical protein
MRAIRKAEPAQPGQIYNPHSQGGSLAMIPDGRAERTG